MVFAGYLAAENASVEQAWTLLREGHKPEAVVLLRRLIHENPADADARLLLGSVLMEEGQREESIAQLAEALRLRPRSARPTTRSMTRSPRALHSSGPSRSIRNSRPRASTWVRC